MNILTRADWGASEASSRRPWRYVDGLVLHWVGVPYIPAGESQAAIANRLNGIQRYEFGKGYSDIAYNHAIDTEGRIWELRGFDHQSGANGSSHHNAHAPAIVYVAGRNGDGSQQTPLTSKAMAAFVWLCREYKRRYPLIGRIQPHSEVRPGGTECPGALVKAFIPELNRLVDEAAVPPQEEEEDVTPEQVTLVLHQFVKQLFTEQKEPWIGYRQALRHQVATAIEEERKD